MSKKNNWKSTSDGQPQEEGNYLVWMPRLESEPVIQNWDGDEWFDQRRGEIISEDVTHYQQLPESPNPQLL